MIIVCKTTMVPGGYHTSYKNLTKKNHYIALSDFYDNDVMVKLKDDIGEECWYHKNNFYSLESHRIYQLDKIGI